ncbi:VOC family protein, partial [Nocardia wallacei]|uniref:VOC family protein n=1 Tax=Nocardia wallacei TaxID=480035 RepID=UPI002457011E
ATGGRDTRPPTLMSLRVPHNNPANTAAHLYLAATDRRDHIERAITLGAKHIADYDEYGISWSTLADPEGNLFDIAEG